MSDIRLPNLELIEYMAKQVLTRMPDYKEAFDKKQKDRTRKLRPDTELIVFPQMWGSTATGFDVDDVGNPTFGGSAMTEAYTVIVHEKIADYYAVFIDERPCYVVHEPTEKFFEDMKNRNMGPRSVARKEY